MTKKLTALRLSKASKHKLLALAEQYGTQTTAIEIAIDRMYREEIRMNDYTWSDVLGNDITAQQAIDMASESGLPLPEWFEQQAFELWGNTADWIDHDWTALAADLVRDASA